MSTHPSEPTATPRPQARTPMESLQAWGMVTSEQVRAAESAAEASGASRRVTTPAQPSADLLAATEPDAPLPDLDEAAPQTVGGTAAGELELDYDRVQSAPRGATPPAGTSIPDTKGSGSWGTVGAGSANRPAVRPGTVFDESGASAAAPRTPAVPRSAPAPGPVERSLSWLRGLVGRD